MKLHTYYATVWVERWRVRVYVVIAANRREAQHALSIEGVDVPTANLRLATKGATAVYSGDVL